MLKNNVYLYLYVKMEIVLIKDIVAYIYDTDINSKYFIISKLPEYFTSGKNYFFMAGSDLLEDGSGVIIEILNSKDEEIEHSVSDYIFNGVDRMIVIELPQTPILDTAYITVVGKLKDAPVEWQHNFNVKWSVKIPINTSLENLCTPIFKKNPYVEVEEIYDENRLVSNYYKQSTTLDTGTVYSKIEGSKSSKDSIYSVYGSNFVKDMVGGKLFISKNDIQVANSDLYDIVDYDGLIKDVVNDNMMIMQMSYKVKNLKTLVYDTVEFTDSNYYILYGTESTGSNENVRNSYLKLKFSDIGTYGGFVKNVDIYKNPGNVYIGQYPLRSDAILDRKFTTVSDFNNNFTFVNSGNLDDIKYDEITHVKNLRTRRVS